MMDKLSDNFRLLWPEGAAAVSDQSLNPQAVKDLELDVKTQLSELEYDVLLINQSGSTGSSAHASATFKDQRMPITSLRIFC